MASTTAIPNSSSRPPQTSIKCPKLTYSGYDAENHQYFCEYQSWAYGIFAIASIVCVMVPLVALICCVTRFRAKRRYIRRLRSTTSSDGYTTSSEQPLIREEIYHQNTVYGAIEPLSPKRSPSTGDRQSESHDDVSVVSSRASLMPAYDQASLDFRNNKAANNFQSSYNYPEPVEKSGVIPSQGNMVSPYASSNVISPRNKTDSPAYAIHEKSTTQSIPSPEYSVLEEPGDIPNDKQDKTSNGPLASEEKPPLVSGPIESDNIGKVEDNLLNAEVPSTEPVYNILEPIKCAPDADKVKETKNQLLEDNNGEHSSKDSFDDNIEANKNNENTEEPRYMPLMFPNKDEEQDNNTLPPPEDKRKSRADYQEILLNAIKSYPIEEQNGSFVVRDSISSPGSKALTVFNKTAESEQQFYNFKICFDESGQAFLAKSKNKFPSIEELLEYLRNNKDMLPCTLRNQINY